MAMAGGDTVIVQPTPLEPMPVMPMPVMPMAARTMAIIPIATATTPTVATDVFWFATSGRGGPLPANTAVDIVSALASLVLVTETGSFTAVADVEADFGVASACLVGNSTHSFGPRHSIPRGRPAKIQRPGRSSISCSTSL